MKSSSELFPVALMDAEFIGRYSVDSYLLKPNNSPDQQVEFALHHFSAKEAGRQAKPLLLVHGLFSNRFEFYDAKGEGLAPRLADCGYDVWIMEWRGHGSSPVKKDYANNTLELLAQYDLPAAIAFIEEKMQLAPVLLSLAESASLPIYNPTIQSSLAGWLIQGDALFVKGSTTNLAAAKYNRKIKLFEHGELAEPESPQMNKHEKRRFRRLFIWKPLKEQAKNDLPVPLMVFSSVGVTAKVRKVFKQQAQIHHACWGAHGMDEASLALFNDWYQNLANVSHATD